MTREIYEAVADPYAYPGSDTLINKLGTHDPKELEAFELEMTTLRADEPLPRGRLSATHYKNIHHHLFQDVYDWAGKYRKIRIAKDVNVFCFPENIESEMRKLFGALKNVRFFKGLPAAQFSKSAAQFIADLNAIHPFREGNGRTQMSFFDVLADAAGHPVDLNLIRRETFLPAMISSFGGNIDLLESEIKTFLS